MLRSIRRALVTAAITAALVTPASPAAALDIEDAVWLTNHSYGSSVEDGDILAALDRIGRNGGSTVDDEDRQVLMRWAQGILEVRETALAQEGDEYQWGGTGPDEFDCSGLTRYAWRSAGIELPHSSRSQYSATQTVRRGDLRIGDLLFFGSPVHHVAIYIGDGKAVEASREGRPVRVTSDALSRGDLVKIGRVGY